MTTKHEKELLEQISTLEKKLEHAEKWMTRQVEETAPRGGRLFSLLHPKQSFSDNVYHFIDRVRHFRFFRRRYTLWELWEKRFEAFLVGAAIILFWRGIWALADQYLFPNNSTVSALASLFIGLGILILSRSFVNQFIDDAIEEADEYE